MSNGEVIVRIAQPLREFTDGRSESQISAKSVGDALLELSTMYPELGRQLIDEHGALRTGMVIGVNGDDIQHAKKLETPVVPGNEIQIVVTALI